MASKNEPAGIGELVANGLPGRLLLTSKQVQTIFGVHRNTLAEWRKPGKLVLPYMRIGRKYFYPLDSVKRVYAERLVEKNATDEKQETPA